LTRPEACGARGACGACGARGARGARPRVAGDRDRDRDQRLLRVVATVDSIPRGRVATYGQVAAEAELPGRARLVGRALAHLPAGSRLPWHRVVAAGGRIALSGASAREQRRRLAREGVRFTARGRVDLTRSR
jgi:methylated-DNA-protein-cysteine methyltransferase-like protein